MSRCSNWPTELARFIAERRERPFDWATNNCCFFACDWLRILTGRDLAADFRSQVSSALDAKRLLAAGGGLDAMAASVFAANGWSECEPQFAQRGDIVEVQTETGPALGICVGSYSVFAGEAGLERRETNLALRAWRIT